MWIIYLVCGGGVVCLLIVVGIIREDRRQASSQSAPRPSRPEPVFHGDDDEWFVRHLIYTGLWPKIRDTLHEISELALKLESQKEIELVDGYISRPSIPDISPEEKRKRDLFNYFGFTHESLAPWIMDLIPHLDARVRPTILLERLQARAAYMRIALKRRQR